MSNTLNHLSEKFAPANAITRAEFREYLAISVSTDCRLKKSGHYPRLINLTGTEKILLTDLAAWLDQGGAPAANQPACRRGRPKGSKNKPKDTKIRLTPTLPASMALALGIHAS